MEESCDQKQEDPQVGNSVSSSRKTQEMSSCDGRTQDERSQTRMETWLPGMTLQLTNNSKVKEF